MNSLQLSSLIPILIASLLGSPHCVGMCGGFVAIYSHNHSKNFIAHLLYNLGRLITYLLLGISAALFGATLDSLLPVAKASALIVGLFLIIAGFLQLLGFSSMLTPKLPSFISNLNSKLLKPIFHSSSPIKPFLIGFFTTFLPCGWLYTFVALALASAKPFEAATIMFFFWLGTLPVLTVLGVLSRTITTRLGRYLPKVTGALLVIGGLLSVSVHFQHAQHSHDVQSNPTEHHHHHH